MTQKIRRDKLVELLSQWQAGDFGGSLLTRRSGRQLVNVWNKTDIDIGLGQPIAVTERMFPNVTEEQAVTEYLNNGVSLTGARPTDDPKEIIAITAEPIRSGGVGRCYLPNVFGAYVRFDDESHRFVQCNEDGFYSAPFGPYRILGHVDAFAFIKPICLGGHLNGTTQEKFTQNDDRTATAIVRYYDEDETVYQDLECLSPLSKPDDVIPAETKVMIHLNALTNKWEIMQAECVEETEDDDE